MEGWICLHKKFSSWGWRDKPEMVSLFIHMLLEANTEPKEWHGEIIEKGQCIFGRRKWAEKLGISEQKLRSSIVNLISTREITIKSTNKFSIITIVKYEEYQNINSESTHDLTHDLTNNQPTINQQLTTPIVSKEVSKKVSKKEKSKSRGTRFGIEVLPNDWKEHCLKKHPLLNPHETFERFHDYWIAQPGQKGLKVDWTATWRNWCRNERPQLTGKPKTPYPTQTEI